MGLSPRTIERRAEVRIGQLTPKESTAPKKAAKQDENLSPAGDKLRPQERSKLRSLAENREVVEEAIAEPVAPPIFTHPRRFKRSWGNELRLGRSGIASDLLFCVLGLLGQAAGLAPPRQDV